MTAVDPTELEGLTEEQVVASLCRESFLDFVKHFIGVVIPGRLKWNWHIDVICNELQYIAERVFAGLPIEHNLLINIPPGMTKSSIITMLFPAWVWTRMPHAEIIGVSYSNVLALELSRECRDVVKSEKYRACFPEVQIREDQDNKGNFVTTKGGKRYAAGSKGTVTGMHADFIIIDDPIDPVRALSEAELGAINYWIMNTLPSRKTDKDVSVTIMVMQRVHVDDPSALMSEAEDTRWLCLPWSTDFTIRPPEMADHYIGGLLDPVRLTRRHIDKLLKPGGPGEAHVACQYGQQPFPIGGGKFKVDRLRWGFPPDKYKKLVRAWDKAGTAAKGNAAFSRGPAFSVGTLEGEDEQGRVWILSVKRARLDSYTREQLIVSTAYQDGHGVVVAIEQEPGSSGLESAQATARRLKGFRVVLSPASGTKEVRAEEFSVCVNGGNCYLPVKMRDGNRWVGWARDWVMEAQSWPNSTYLDQIDSASLGYRELVRPKVRVGGLKAGRSKQEARTIRRRQTQV